MAKYKKKPVIIDAEHVYKLLDLATNDWNALPQWVKDNHEKGDIAFFNNSLSILTSRGRMMADYYDYLIRDINGEIYPCKSNIFENTYEMVNC